MQELHLFGISINDVRDIFGAEEALAARLVEVAGRQHLPTRPRSLVERIGPLFRRPPSTTVDPRLPTPADVRALLAGGHVAPDRLAPCWSLLLLWLSELCAHQLTLELDGLDDLEFDLARAGLPSDYSLRHLARRELGIPLRPRPGQLVGYSKHVHVVETHRQLRRIADDTTPLPTVIAPLLSLLEAVSNHRPELDLVVVSTPG